MGGLSGSITIISFLTNLTTNMWVWSPLRRGVFNTTLCDKVCQRQVSGFLQALAFLPSVKLTATI